MKQYKVDITINKENGKHVRRTIYTMPKSNEKEAITYAFGIMKMQNGMLSEDVTYFVHSIKEVA